MSTELIKKELTQLEQDILSVISTSEISSPIQIANLLDVPEEDVIAILNNDSFYELICARSLGNMRLAYHSKAIPKLINQLDSEHKFFEAYDRLVKTIGAVKEKDNEGMKVSLEVLVKEKKEEKNITPNLNTVSKVTGNIFALEEEGKQSQVSPHTKQTIEIDYEWEE